MRDAAASNTAVNVAMRIKQLLPYPRPPCRAK